MIAKWQTALPTLVVEELKHWRLVSLYRSDEDLLFPSIGKMDRSL